VRAIQSKVKGAVVKEENSQKHYGEVEIAGNLYKVSC